MQPQDPSAPHWSPDGFWWWDGSQWVPAAQAPMPPPPTMPPPGYPPLPPPLDLKPSPGLRPFLIVMLALQALFTGVFALGGLIAVSSGDTSSMWFLALILLLFALAVCSLVGVFLRAAWARWVALASGIAMCLTCLGALVGIPIVVAAARAPLHKAPAT